MSNHGDIYTYSNADEKANEILKWFGANTTRNSATGTPLPRRPDESSYDYFCRWLQRNKLQLNWKEEAFPQAPEGKRVLWRPIVNGFDLSACSVGIGASSLDAERAKEDACEALIKACRCVRRATFDLRRLIDCLVHFQPL
ncbi:hypothetical protein OPQ81_001088 [Rhizoctonia solani]|nr:hypothetical protein OPQ81_001088 [Rhizoctonia solani]